MRLSTRTLATGLTAALLTGCFAIGCSPSSEPDASQSADKVSIRADDPTGRGPLEVTSSEYRFPAKVDADILGDRMTEVWAHVWRPAKQVTGKKAPLLVFLHGNHGTCGTGSNPRRDNNVQYTTQGTCPPGYVVTPNHMGYEYIAERLASWGYMVVSINANRGITAGGGAPGDGGLNLARGRLVLKHLQLLSEWNAKAGSTPDSVGADLAGSIDFDNVGMMGHSRGGEGVRAAYVQYHDAGSPWPARIKSQLGVKGIFEIGPVDGQTGRTLTPLGTAWNVILPMCDGDVSNLQGMKPFDRLLAATTEPTAASKGMFAVWGANHNYFNTEWQESDARGCAGTAHNPLWQPGVVGSAKQKEAGLHALMGFFRAHVGVDAEPTLNRAYDPQYGVPDALQAITRVQRAYADASHPSQVVALEDFTKPAGTSSAGLPEVASQVTVTHAGVNEHDPVLKAANIKWTAASAETFYELPWSATGSGVDASRMMTLDLRVARQTGSSEPGSFKFKVQLVNADDSLSQPVEIANYIDLVAPGGHLVLDTARIPLEDFQGVNLAKVRGLRLTFSETTAGGVLLSNVRLSRSEALTSPAVQAGTPVGLGSDTAEQPTRVIATGNKVNAVRPAGAGRNVEVELASDVEFHVTNELPRLRVAGRDSLAGRYNDDGDTHRIVFTMTPEEFDALPEGSAMKVRYGDEKATHEWDFGAFQKSTLKR